MKILKTTIDTTLENDGVGSWECHGRNGYDEGTTWLEGTVTIYTDAHFIQELDQWVASEEGIDAVNNAMANEATGYNNVEWDGIESFRNKDGFYCVMDTFTADPPEKDHEYDPDY